MIKPDNWKPADGLTLEPNAYIAAKECERSLALTAGPGAGKTEMLAQRADFLLRTGTCRYPKRILAISFKVDASDNLKQRVKRRCSSDLSSRFDSYTFHAFAKRIIDRFRPILTGDDALEVGFTIGPKIPHRQVDFVELVPLATQILNVSPLARNAVRKTYTDVFLDEFQDCTNQQYELIKAAFQGAGTRLTAVGDTKQKIMGWAGALDGIFDTFKEDFNALPLNMYRNFRSKPALLRLQNEIIRHLDLGSVMPDHQISGEEGIIQIHPFQNCQEEADYLANEIESWINDEDIPPSEIAILIKNQPELYANRMMVALQEKGIPFRNEQQLQDISVEPAARLIVDFLLSTFGIQEPAAWRRLMEKLVPFNEDEDERGELLQDWQRFIQTEKRAASENPIKSSNPKRWDCLKRFINKVGFQFLASLSHDYETESYLRQVLKDTCSKIDELMRTGLPLNDALKRFEDDQAVRILTIHKSKGLEFDSVIMLGIEDESFWGDPDENLCAYFVGVSRAKRRLYLTYSKFRSRPAGYTRKWKNQRNRKKLYLECVRQY
ncbi:UvrD-helicase domain-containing protein [Photorhabdus namnaonensis]|uniref:DNA 3'-5' helicase n=1 Tax=Photorhabdus namnaonensis TaxID=1851568 RepID=A0A1B8YFC1_9GAMM|nr:ATP-dependent helicase [Photorhabdus namnaonensis]OCA53757.1 ATP-dependent DNA helicase PcrA [Photorhabdus namnaonensis]